MKKLYFLILISVLISCNGYQYVATPAYVPLHENKNELKFSLSPNNFQLGYSITNHIGIFGTIYYRYRMLDYSFSMMSGKEGSGGQIIKDNSVNTNLGVLYFFKDPFFCYEIQAGAGFGSYYYNNDIDGKFHYVFTMNGRKLNGFLQADAGYKIKKIFEAGIFTKFTETNYNHIDTEYTDSSPMSYDKHDLTFHNKNSMNLLFIDQGVQIKVGGEKVKFQAQVSFPINLGGQYMYYRPINIFLGISLNLSLLNAVGTSDIYN